MKVEADVMMEVYVKLVILFNINMIFFLTLLTYLNLIKLLKDLNSKVNLLLSNYIILLYFHDL